MYTAEICQKIIQKYPNAKEIPLPEKFVRDPSPQIKVQAGELRELCQILKDDNDFLFDLPIHMTAVDYIKENEFELVYPLYSTRHKVGVIVKVRIQRSDPQIDSLVDLWDGFDFQEREVFDLMGVTFRGHPYLKKIMMWDGFPGHPLRKDYVHITDKYDSGLEIGTPGLDAKGIPIVEKPS